MLIGSLFLLLVLLFSIAFVICGFVIAFRSRNPVVRWGFGISAAVILLGLTAGGAILFLGVPLPDQL